MAQEHLDHVSRTRRHNEILIAVAVEVAGHHQGQDAGGIRRQGGNGFGRCKCAVPVAQQEAEHVVAVEGNHVGFAVPVEVGGNELYGSAARRVNGQLEELVGIRGTTFRCTDENEEEGCGGCTSRKGLARAMEHLRCKKSVPGHTGSLTRVLRKGKSPTSARYDVG